jgi:DNA mismatch repair protein MutS
MRQYYDIKEENPGCILFFRMGDFFELFDEDAKTAARILGITLTSRNNGASGATPLCGFPHHSADRYVPKMVAAGYRVAICEQVEDPKLAKGIVKRSVVEVISAGTAMDAANLNAKEPNYLCAIHPKGDTIYFAFADVTTGFFAVSSSSAQVLESELFRRMPREILVEEGLELPPFIRDFVQGESVLVTPLSKEFFDYARAEGLLLSHFAVDSAESLGLDYRISEAEVAGAALRYLTEQKKSELSHITQLEFLDLNDYMTLDPATLRNLELIRPLNSEDLFSTLYSVLDYTVTAMGGRLLREWISHPLVSFPKIRERQAAVAELTGQQIVLDDLKVALREILDMERLMGRIGSGRANARDLIGMGRSLVKAAGVSLALSELSSPVFQRLRDTLSSMDGRGEEILAYLKPDAPLTIREGGMICEGADAELDRMNADIRDRREWMSSLEGRERERLGINSLRVSYNKVFGYYIEVSKTHSEKIPPEYIRKQTTVNAERYITPEMKECETVISSAEFKINALEYKIFSNLRDRVNSWRAELQRIAEAVAETDSFYSLSKAARKRGYVRPEILETPGISIQGGFHPVIAAVNPELSFVPNDTELQINEDRMMLITGPNMAGKSTYLRQTGLIVLMAQVGSFVPAASAKIGIVDRIFTRVGASDRLSRGLSTFMVEMIETANILRNASPKSLVLLDEIGRGTSTFDGLSIAWAIVEALHGDSNRQAFTLFATHYHELTALIDTLSHAGNYQVSVKEDGDRLIFLHKIIKGACDSSYGIHVAEMAGLPADVVRRARRILHRLEKQQIDPSDGQAAKKLKEKPQMDVFSPPDENTQLLMNEIRRIKPEEMTPLAALQFLTELKEHYAK